MSEYLKLQKQMQALVKVEFIQNPKPTHPVDLRVGVNTAMCDHAALARLLVEKGIITREEYTQALTDEMKREIGRYEKIMEGD